VEWVWLETAAPFSRCVRVNGTIFQDHVNDPVEQFLQKSNYKQIVMALFASANVVGVIIA
jgi:hypothetical protein